MRAVLDPNVIISGLLSPNGAPARILREWLEGGFEVVVSLLLLGELERALGYARLRDRVSAAERQKLIELLGTAAEVRQDPAGVPPVRSQDPGDDYLIALGSVSGSVLVSGDKHLLDLKGSIPVFSPAEFISSIQLPPRPA